jgi:hypothetical protein
MSRVSVVHSKLGCVSSYLIGFGIGSILESLLDAVGLLYPQRLFYDA